MTHKEENIVNIAMKAAELLTSGKIERNDITGHMGLTEHIISMSDKFEQEHAGVDFDEDGRDYWLEIDDFAEKELIAEYGREGIAPSIPGKEQAAEENTIKLWARVGMTLEVSPETYEQLKAGNDQALEGVLRGQGGSARLDGETYFPDIEQNRELGEMEFYLVDHSEHELFSEKEPAVILPEDPVKVYAVSSGGVKHEVYSGTWDECKEFCKQQDWAYVDENQFEWELKLEDSRENSLPEGYYDALTHFNREIGHDIENEFVRQHAEELVSCFQNGKSLIDFDFWTKYESDLGEKMTYDEYVKLDATYDGDPMDITSKDTHVISELKDTLNQIRSESQEKEPVRPSLNDQIQSAQSRQHQQNHNSGEKEHER